MSVSRIFLAPKHTTANIRRKREPSSEQFEFTKSDDVSVSLGFRTLTFLDSSFKTPREVSGGHIGFCAAHKSPLQKHQQLWILTYSGLQRCGGQFCFDSLHHHRHNSKSGHIRFGVRVQVKCVSNVVNLTQTQRGPMKSKHCKTFVGIEFIKNSIHRGHRHF